MKTGLVTMVVGISVWAAACSQASAPAPPSPLFHVEVISSRDLPPQFSGVTYVYEFADANSDSLATVFVNAGIPWNQAWQPLDNRCMDPQGPRFTVELQTDELEANDGQMERYDFVRGTGQLACSEWLRHYFR